VQPDSAKGWADPELGVQFVRLKRQGADTVLAALEPGVDNVSDGRIDRAQRDARLLQLDEVPQ
jgi:hypothetical protein